MNLPIWYITSDISHYLSNASAGEGGVTKQLISFPAREEIINELKINLNSEFISTSLPPKEFENFFIIKKLDNAHGLLTTQQHIAKIEEHTILQQSLGIGVVKSDLSFKDLAGARKLKEWVSKFKIAEEKGYRSKGIFSVGLPGTGKTFFAQCLSGELARPLVILNLAFLQAKENPIQELNNIFEYLNNTNSKQIILIDEIEKMVGTGEDPLTGRLMTILSDLYSSAGEYKKLDVLILATANNLDSILKNQPALLRRGRFDELFFQNTPKIDEVEEYFNLYAKKYKLEMALDMYGVAKLIKDIGDEYEEINPQSKNFIYTPSEIATYFKRLDFERLAGETISKELMTATIKEIVPIIKSAQEGVKKIIAQKEQQRTQYK